MVERVSVRIGADELHFETGKIAKQAHGAVMAMSGDTYVLSAVCVAQTGNPDADFFPLTVDYREKSFAAGRIPGNFFRREGRPTEREILVSRLTDRPIRPLFPKGFTNEVQVFQTVFSADNEHDPGVLSINAASAALHISPVPFNGPIGAVRIGMFDGELVVNPAMPRMAESQIDLVIAGTKDGIVMVEGSAKEVDEDIMVEALEMGHIYIRRICEAIEELRAKVGIEKMAYTPKEYDPAIMADVAELAAQKMDAALSTLHKQERQTAVDAVKNETQERLAEKYGPDLYEERLSAINDVLDATERRLLREKVLKTNTRLDGRALDQIRNISIEVGILPRAHGSCLFTRGETQAIVTATLGTSRDEQRLDELTGEEFKRFMLHYNFPSWSVGEVRRISGPGRREVGHGRLAERALENMIPSANGDFPYTIRVVSDITESNGSSSMASVCGGTLALMDAGVPIGSSVAGIAMGLIKEGEDVAVLTDILGAEDHFGDMDFKVCGTRKGITAFQMDIKIGGISSDIMRKALKQAQEGRLFILGKMDECLSAPREEISQYAPRIYTIKIDVDKIREVIGPGGKVVREITAKSGAEIDIQDDGTINVAAVDKDAADIAIQMIKDIVAEVEVGEIYLGTVTRLAGFGAFVSVLGSREGLVRNPDLTLDRIRDASEAVNIGDTFEVKVVEIDKMGRVNLSKIEADRDLGRLSEEDNRRAAENRADDRERRSSGGRDRDRYGHGGGGGGGGGRDRYHGRDRGGRH
jgi:polyribonucleotide nucleotidyltransferase